MKKIICLLTTLVLFTSSFSQGGKKMTFCFESFTKEAKWKELPIPERIQAIQIPKEIISDIPTDDLLDICLDYPFLIEFTFCDDYQIGLSRLLDKFNGFHELLQRADLIEVMLKKDRNLDNELKSIVKKEPSVQGLFSFQNLALELMFFNERIIHKINASQKEDLYSIICTNKKIRAKYPSIFSDVNNIPERLITSLNNGSSNNTNKSLLSFPNYQTKTIYTPKGTLVPDTWYLESGDASYTDSQIDSWRLYIYNTYDGAELLNINTYKFNNPGYTWYTSENLTDPVIIGRYNAFADTVYWADNSYIEVPETIATKVLYDRRGLHSAVRESSEWYVSKWGNGGPLVRHHPNAIPDGSGIIDVNYYPNSMNRNYYMRNPNCSINGAQLILGGYATYSVNNLPAGWTVTWSLSDSYYHQNCLQQDYPTTNECTIYHSPMLNMNNGILTAEVKYAGTTILTVSKSITATSSFVGHYTSGSISQDINYPYPLNVIAGTTVNIYSPNLIGATAYYQNQYTAIPTSWSFNSTSGYLYVGMPANSNIPVIVYVDDIYGRHYILPLLPSTSYNYSMDIFSNMNSINVSIKSEHVDNLNTNNTEQSGNIGTIAENTLQTGFKWILEIYNVITGEKITTQSVTGSLISLDTSGWKRGVYAVHAIIGKEVLTEKIQVK